MMDARVVNSDLVVELVRASHCLKLVTTLTLTLDPDPNPDPSH